MASQKHQPSGDPNKRLPFEVQPHDEPWVFTPEFYPNRFTQTKGRELLRNARQCGGEKVSIKKIKNREFHVSGLILEGEVPIFQKFLDHDGLINVISPLTPNGGMECHIKTGELGNQKGWDPHTRQWMFEYSFDLVSTGRDEYDSGKNAIVTEITGGTF